MRRIRSLQGNDFLHLYDTFGCQMEVGGADQWGNITAGTDLVYKTMFVGAFGTKRKAWILGQNLAILLCVSLAVTNWMLSRSIIQTHPDGFP